MKECRVCHETKPLSEFHKFAQMADGHFNRCKECAKASSRAWYANNLDKARAYLRSKAKEPGQKALIKKACAEYRSRHPERVAATTAVNLAIRAGSLVRLPCWVCGEKAVAHHADYSAPLDVVWLCPLHHKQTHALAKELSS